MKMFQWIIIAIILRATVFSSFGQNTNAPLPAIEPLLQHVLEQAKKEGDNDRAFDARYSYSRIKVTEYRDLAGELKKREEKSIVHGTAAQPVAARPDAASERSGTVSDTHSNVHGKQFKRNDFLLDEDLASRFQFTLVGRELLNGRPALIIDFVPAAKTPPERNLKDRFINKAAGRVWIDEADYSLVKADLHLTEQVNVGFGFIGAVWKFHYGFERKRTDDSLWFTSSVDWHLEGREVVINRRVDYHEETTGIRKTAP